MTAEKKEESGDDDHISMIQHKKKQSKKSTTVMNNICLVQQNVVKYNIFCEVEEKKETTTQTALNTDENMGDHISMIQVKKAKVVKQSNYSLS